MPSQTRHVAKRIRTTLTSALGTTATPVCNFAYKMRLAQYPYLFLMIRFKRWSIDLISCAISMGRYVYMSSYRFSACVDKWKLIVHQFMQSGDSIAVLHEISSKFISQIYAFKVAIDEFNAKKLHVIRGCLVRQFKMLHITCY